MKWHYANDPPKENGWYYVYAPTWCGTANGKISVNGCMFSYYRNGKWGIEVNNSDCVEQWANVPFPPRADIELINSIVEEPCKKDNEIINSQPVFKVIKKEVKK